MNHRVLENQGWVVHTNFGVYKMTGSQVLGFFVQKSPFTGKQHFMLQNRLCQLKRPKHYHLIVKNACFTPLRLEILNENIYSNLMP